MSGKFFLDTNILIYASSNQEPRKAGVAERLVRRLLLGRNGVISYQVMQEYFSVGFRRFDPPLTLEEAERYLDHVLRPLLKVQSSAGLAREALHLRERYRLSWYDSLIVAAALEARCSVLYTEDLQHGQRFGELVVEDPFRG